MSKKLSIVTNSVIACVLLVLCVAVATTDLSDVYTTVSAPINSGDTKKKNVSLMFTVCEDSKYINSIMDVLDDAGAEATWFLTGNWIQKNMQMTKDIASRFEIGNHSYTHTQMTTMKEAEQKTEILNTHTLAKSITTVEMTLFTPPSESFNKTTLKVAENLGYKTIMWSKNTACCTTEDKIYDTATKEQKNGELIHLHPTEQTFKALPRILDFYKMQGIGIVAVGRIIS